MPRAKNFILIIVALALVSAATAALAQRPEAQAPANDKFERGKQLYERGDTAAAIPLLRDAAGLRKTDADVWYFYGLALNRAGQAKDARKAFEKTLKLRPDDAFARVGLAYTLLYVHKPRDAESEAQRALKLNPQLAEAHYVVGVIRFAEEKFPDAAEEASTALRLKPELYAAAYLLGDALLNVYVDESEQSAKQYPLPTLADDEARRPVLEKREAALEPIRARMRDLADHLEAFAKSHPNDPEFERWREQVGSLRFYGNKGGGTPGVLRSTEVTQRAVITFKLEPSYTMQAREHNVKGIIRLRAVLAADGRITNIIAIKRLPDGLTEKAIEAARQIKFTPATVNGQPVSQFVMLEYNFNIY
ncbi:MAG TPA: tetratricopeptide repeat protein [Pyrinomonadaceae bacterium]|nr:tetratricopeptide repeat protein [Pyrinomonadaceae bacterium]